MTTKSGTQTISNNSKSRSTFAALIKTLKLFFVPVTALALLVFFAFPVKHNVLIISHCDIVENDSECFVCFHVAINRYSNSYFQQIRYIMQWHKYASADVPSPDSQLTAFVFHVGKDECNLAVGDVQVPLTLYPTPESLILIGGLRDEEHIYACDSNGISKLERLPPDLAEKWEDLYHGEYLTSINWRNRKLDENSINTSGILTNGTKIEIVKPEKGSGTIAEQITIVPRNGKSNCLEIHHTGEWRLIEESEVVNSGTFPFY